MFYVFHNTRHVDTRGFDIPLSDIESGKFICFDKARSYTPDESDPGNVMHVTLYRYYKPSHTEQLTLF